MKEPDLNEVKKWTKSGPIRQCPLCGAQDYYVASSKMQFGLDLDTVICRHCSFVHTNPVPEEELYNRFYEVAYSKFYGKISTPINQKVISPYIKDKIDLLSKYIDVRKSSMLEIGPGNGAFLFWSSKRFKLVTGIEPSEDFVSKMKGLNIRVLNGTVETVKLEDEKFDVVCMFHVLEHFYDPNTALQKIRCILNDGALLVLEIPNILKPFKSLDHYFLRYVHPSNFSPNTVTKILVKHGFEIVHFNDGDYDWRVPQNIFCIAKKVVSQDSSKSVFNNKDYEDVLQTLQDYRKNWKLISLKWKFFNIYNPSRRFVNRLLFKLRGLLHV
jgi:SAM-dependent methyltransferase